MLRLLSFILLIKIKRLEMSFVCLYIYNTITKELDDIMGIHFNE